MNQDLRSAFFEKFIPEPNSGCWLWTGSMEGGGYGCLTYKQKKYTGHRLSWEIHTGQPPGRLCVCHKCDNRLCVNPEHLFLGTAQDNMRDAGSKGRLSFRTNKLSTSDVLDIFTSAKTGTSLAKKYGVSKGRVSLIRNGLAWVWLTSQQPGALGKRTMPPAVQKFPRLHKGAAWIHRPTSNALWL